MVKVVALVLVLLLTLSSVSMVACNGEDADETTSQESEEELEDEEDMPSGGGGSTWDNIPIYPRTNQLGYWEWARPGYLGDWSIIGWRYYETNDKVSTVSQFYKAQMPNNGWQQSMWTEGGDETGWGFYMKNNEQDGAMVWILAEAGKTLIALMRGWE